MHASPRAGIALSALALALPTAVLTLPAAAQADPAPQSGTGPAPARVSWAILPNSALDSTSQAALLGIPQNRTLLAYRTPGADPHTERLATATIMADGSIAPGPYITTPGTMSTNPADSNDGSWSTLANPALVGDRNVLQAVWGGIYDQTDGAPSLETARNTTGGAWSYQMGGIDVNHCDPSASCPNAPTDEGHSYASDVSTIELEDGTLLSAWGSSDGVFVHRGSAPNAYRVDNSQTEAPASSAEFQSQLGGNFGYGPTLSHLTDGSNPTIAWYSNADGHQGVYLQHVDPATGNPVGSPALVPGSQSLVGTKGRTPLTGRVGSANFYTALPSSAGTGVTVSQLAPDGSFQQAVLDGNGGTVGATNVTADSAGRLWAMWSQADASGDLHLFAARSGASGFQFGPPVEVAIPANGTGVFALDGVAQSGPLNLVATFDTGQGVSATEIEAAQLVPADAVTASPVTAAPGAPAAANVTVTDAGAPVPGAQVQQLGGPAADVASAGRRHPRHPRAPRLAAGTTNTRGVARLHLAPHARSWIAVLRVTRKGYVSRIVRLKVRVR